MMNRRQLSAAALTLALACSAPVCATEGQDRFQPQTPPASSAPLTRENPSDLPQEVNVPIPARYAAAVTVNGEALNEVTFTNYNEETGEEEEVTMKFSELPGAPPGYVPMRLVCAADPGGFSFWSPEENAAIFILNENRVMVYFDDLSVERDEEKVEGTTAYLSGGVTFLPVDFLNGLDGVRVDFHPEMDSERYDVILEVDPLLALVNTIRETLEMGMGEQMTDEMFGLLEIDTSNFDSIVGVMPMMINADTVIIGKYAPGADKAAAKKDFEGRKEATIQNFENYLPDPLEMAKNGRIVESKDGNYLMLIISSDNDRAVQMFEAGVAADADM